jgi:2-amino-4-hydroxy-6-hydroxymethyldihydropteridine diphosphokinase
MAARAAIAFGSNLGDSRATIREAVRMLEATCEVEAVSSFFRSDPMYLEDQPSFNNSAALVTTDLGPLHLIQEIKKIERSLGRQQRERNGPREIDIDLITFGSLRLWSNAEPSLVLPHPRAGERRFVLEPLAELDSSLILPGLGSVSDLLSSSTIQAQHLEKEMHEPIPV